MRRYWLIALGICVAGCVASNGLQYESTSGTNLYHIAKVRKGMSERQVLQIMHKPYSYESFEFDDDVYDVWFYVTRMTGLDQTRMVPQNLTPLTFKNGILVGTGFNWYYYAMKGQVEEAAAQNPVIEKPRTQEAEDIDFEKALKTTPNKSAAPRQSAPTQPSQGGSMQKALDAPAQQTTPQNEKLPPNVRIVNNDNGNFSCGTCPEKVRGSNRFSILSKGMSETQVVNIIGDPMKYETFEIGYDVYDVWFYETVASKTGKPSKIPQNMTPITFKNAVLISMNDDEFYALKERAGSPKQAVVSVEQPLVVPAAKTTIFKPYVPKTPLGVVDKTFSKVRKGMSEDDVMNLLGSTIDQESMSIGRDVYDIWFYDVASSKKNTPSKKVPLTFKNGVLVGTTVEEYNKVKNQAGTDRVGDYDREADRMQEDESEQNFNSW